MFVQFGPWLGNRQCGCPVHWTLEFSTGGNSTEGNREDIWRYLLKILLCLVYLKGCGTSQFPSLFQNIKEQNPCFPFYNFAKNRNDSFQRQCTFLAEKSQYPHFGCGSQASVSCMKSNLKPGNKLSTESTNLLMAGLSFWACGQFAHSSLSPTPPACPRGWYMNSNLKCCIFYEMAHGMPRAYPLMAGYICPHALLLTQCGTNINSLTRDIFHMFGL